VHLIFSFSFSSPSRRIVVCILRIRTELVIQLDEQAKRAQLKRAAKRRVPVPKMTHTQLAILMKAPIFQRHFQLACLLLDFRPFHLPNRATVFKIPLLFSNKTTRSMAADVSCRHLSCVTDLLTTYVNLTWAQLMNHSIPESPSCYTQLLTTCSAVRGENHLWFSHSQAYKGSQG
jgi:hypothetical protein